ncbi:MAG: NapH/MauN family ferredoxin-type protein [Campylobacter sp.]|nr:NapH/MauN family ferredoxin-type protein [Campylobacter sp.]
MDKYSERSTVARTPFLKTFFGKNRDGKYRPTIRFYRFFVIILMHLLFILSYRIDLQILEGSISASRLFGLHLADAFITIEAIVASHQIPTNLIIGSLTILMFYTLFGGRAFCSWVCPYNLLGEIGERINALLIRRRIIKKREFNPKFRYFFLAVFIAATFISGYLIFEMFNVVGIFSRFLIYGYSVAFSFVIIVLMIEIFFSRRAWCRYICPLGTTYELICGHTNAIKISWDKESCDHCNVCIDACIVPHVLRVTKDKHKDDENGQFLVTGADCTLCGRCIDVCHHDSLKFENRLKKLL